MKKSIFVATLLALFFVSTAFALEPGDTLWTRTYGGDANDRGFRLQATSDGGYIWAGYTKSRGAGDYDIWLLKLDANEDTVWSRTYGGVDYDACLHAEQTDDGGYIIGGYTMSFGVGGFDVYLVKTDPAGEVDWTCVWGESSNEYVSCVTQTTDGGYIVAGNTQSYSPNQQMDAFLLKADASGNVEWTNTYKGQGDRSDFGRYVLQTPDGGYLLCGSATNEIEQTQYVWLVKTDQNGDSLWARAYDVGVDYDLGQEIKPTSDGGYIIAGWVGVSTDPWAFDLLLMKLDANCDSLWTRRYGTELWDLGQSVEQTTDGGYIVTGFTNGENDVYDIWVLKTDANGDTLWTRTYGGPGNDNSSSILETTDGNYLISGKTDSLGAGGYDFYLLKLAGEAPGPDVSIEIVPDDPPVTVPQGGTFGYTGTVTNNTEDPQTTDIWVMAVGPTKEVYGPFKDFYEFPLNPGQSRSAHFNQRVHNQAPLGFYNYIAYCGDYPSTVVDSSFFEIEVVEGVGSSQAGWVLTGSFLEGDVGDIPFEFALLSNYPNPFNASTVISYGLPTTSHVKLEIYNLFGQKVATVVDDQQEAGYRSVLWDASETSSGIYFYKLTAGDFTQIKTMTLLK